MPQVQGPSSSRVAPPHHEAPCRVVQSSSIQPNQTGPASVVTARQPCASLAPGHSSRLPAPQPAFDEVKEPAERTLTGHRPDRFALGRPPAIRCGRGPGLEHLRDAGRRGAGCCGPGHRDRRGRPPAPLPSETAIIDDRGDGLVISAIHARGESRTCAKGIVGGDSEVTWSPEEQRALAAARTGRRNS